MSIFLKISSFYKFSRHYKFLLIELFFRSLIIEYYLRTGRLKRLKYLYSNSEERDALTPEQAKYLRSTIRAMKVIERNAFWNPKCYNIALTVKKTLLKRSIDSSLHIGFLKKSGDFIGHAWLTRNDQVIIGMIDNLSAYKTVDSSDKAMPI